MVVDVEELLILRVPCARGCEKEKDGGLSALSLHEVENLITALTRIIINDVETE